MTRRPGGLLFLLGFALVTFGVGLRFLDPQPIQDLRYWYFDQLQRLSPREVSDLPIRVIDIDEQSLGTIGQWPWPRTEVARLAQELMELGAATIVFDILFAEPDRYSPARLLSDPRLAEMVQDQEGWGRVDNDEIFAESIRGLPVVLGVASRLGGETPENIQSKAGVVEIGEQPTAALYSVPVLTGLAPPLASAAAGIANINVSPQMSGGVVRKVPLFWMTPNGPLPTLSLEALRLALGETTFFVEGIPGVPGAVQSIGVGGYTIPTSDQAEIWVRYRHDHPSLYVPAHVVLNTQEHAAVRELIEGHIVFVGTSAAGLLDIRSTSLGENVPGVSIHAQILEQILLEDGLFRSDLVAGIEVLAIVALGLIVSLMMSVSGPIPSLAAGGAAALVVLMGSWIAFQRHGVLFDSGFPLAVGVVNFGLLVAYQYIVTDREKRIIRRSFAQYVAPEVLHKIEASGGSVELGGENREVTVLFCDIRNFTPLSETMSPPELVNVLNALFSHLGDEILAEKGTIDKFIGDSIMAFWNAPLPLDNHERHAAMAALKMRQALSAFNKDPIMESRAPISLAIGCATGPACVGNIGSRQRFNYTAIGDTVNISARIEASCRALAYDIVISEEMAKAANGQLATLEAGDIALKGKSSRLTLHALVGGDEVAASEAFVTLLKAHSDLMSCIRKGQTDMDQLFVHCAELSRRVEPGLPAFYEAMSLRRSDFILS
ncbi:guanylate cyclase [Marivita geojedonensis]|uniref:Guanylate cyclase n=1 Tax=Marivita geojedonensis TaxID=1123756 RepID=A0A1X4NHH9_9RHOB|nr:guanylate cyclase [Marivita geojedonensis]